MVFSLALQLHRLVPECLLQVGEVVHVSGLSANHLTVYGTAPGATHDTAHFLLLLDEHVFLEEGLLELLPEAKALIDVHGQLDFNLLRLRQLNVSL